MFFVDDVYDILKTKPKFKLTKRIFHPNSDLN